MLPDGVLADIASFMHTRYNLDFTPAEIETLIIETDLAPSIAMGWPDTDEREMWLDALSVKFAGRHWPCNMDSDDSWVEDFVRGYRQWKKQSHA
jgi:hypothetical protein